MILAGRGTLGYILYSAAAAPGTNSSVKEGDHYNRDLRHIHDIVGFVTAEKITRF
jgi:hypothetical protein